MDSLFISRSSLQFWSNHHVPPYVFVGKTHGFFAGKPPPLFVLKTTIFFIAKKNTIDRKPTIFSLVKTTIFIVKTRLRRLRPILAVAAAADSVWKTRATLLFDGSKRSSVTPQRGTRNP